jgi:hypothetical protein
VALIAILAMLLPGVFALTGADPDWMLGIEAADHGGGHSAEPVHDPHAAAHSHGGQDYSQIPGSRDHPADHDCGQCQILKFLLSYLPALPLLLPAPASRPIRLEARIEAQVRALPAPLPPSRAPPPRDV